MKRTTAVLFAIALGSATAAYAGSLVSKKGAWPKTWPTELEPLREQSGTIREGQVELVIHRIPFKAREEFETAWPHLLSIKTKGAPVVLVKSPHKHWALGQTAAGVVIHCPPGGKEPAMPKGPREHASNLTDRWLWTTWIELVVDGDIVDLNRIELPAGTPIIDQRFDDGPQESPAAGQK